MTELDLCVITPVHNNTLTLEELTRRILTTVDKMGVRALLVFVDDGSTDSSWDTITSLATGDDRIRGFSIVSRRGQAAAVAFAVKLFRPTYFVSIDADLEYWPEDIPLLVERLDAGADVACGVRVRDADHRRRPLRNAFTWMHARSAPKVIRARIHDPGAGLKAFTYDFYLRSFTSDHLKEGILHLYAFATSARRIDNVTIHWSPRPTGSSYSTSRLALLAGEESLVSDPRWPEWILQAGGASLTLGAAALALDVRRRGERGVIASTSLIASGVSLVTSAVSMSLLSTAMRAGAPPYEVDRCGGPNTEGANHHVH